MSAPPGQTLALVADCVRLDLTAYLPKNRVGAPSSSPRQIRALGQDNNTQGPSLSQQPLYLFFCIMILIPWSAKLSLLVYRQTSLYINTGY